MILEGYEKQTERDMYYQKNYVPDIDEPVTNASREEELNSFDAFLAAVDASGLE